MILVMIAMIFVTNVLGMSLGFFAEIDKVSRKPFNSQVFTAPNILFCRLAGQL